MSVIRTSSVPASPMAATAASISARRRSGSIPSFGMGAGYGVLLTGESIKTHYNVLNTPSVL
jgi:hypothetical protein